MGASGYRVPPVPQYDSTMGQTADMTTVRKITDDASPNTITQTIKQKVPANQAATWQPDVGAKAKPFWGLQDWFRDMARRRYEESMKARRGY